MRSIGSIDAEIGHNIPCSNWIHVKAGLTRFLLDTSSTSLPSPTCSSVVRAFFVDADTAYWQTTRLRSILATSPTEVVVAPPGIPHTAAEALQGRRCA